LARLRRALFNYIFVVTTGAILKLTACVAIQVLLDGTSTARHAGAEIAGADLATWAGNTLWNHDVFLDSAEFIARETLARKAYI
jgi:hypothetical protein